ncbi:MAG: peptidoglycan bridge formation glycyltransferase FemA/FemB family protein [Candidatus Gracilibacteria bacterium]|nr:peptidoglycan bridge formation glycyltransferase FemA/FemB family protein [Candidatus Gracilibacteria bacterium]
MSIWQTKSWQEMLNKSNQTQKYFEFDGVFVEKRSIGLGQFGLFVLGVNKKTFNNEILVKLKKLAKDEKVVFLQVETLGYNADFLLESIDIKKGYYKKFITPFTAIIDLSKSLDEILSLMKPKGRYNIKLAEKKGIKVIEAEKNIENIKAFYDLMLETTSRDSFSGNSLNYYIDFLNNIESSKLFLAYFEEKIISAGIFTYEAKEAIYYYGASTSDSKYRNLMSPYLLQWTAICKAKELSCETYDFLGVASPGDEKSPLKGVTDFKSKFTSDIIEVSTSYIYVNNKIKYNFLQILRKFKR